jgi:tRNA A-37 threonylcarbamoyl transferase component Bud32
MHSLRVLEDLPSGYFVEESPRGILALHTGVARALHDAGYGPEQDGEVVQSELSGRRPLHEFRVADEAFVVRRFSHGGLLRWLTGVRFLDAQRPFRELILSESLRRAGIRTPRVVAARARAARGFGWLLEVVSRRLEGTIDLGHVLGRARRGEVDRSAQRRLLRELGLLVARLHKHGCLHADLTPNNMLVNLSALEGDAPELWVLDLDGSTMHDSLTDAQRRKNLRRMFRFVERRERRYGKALTLTDYARFFRGYDESGRCWKADWRAVAAMHSRRSLLHSLGWVFERSFAPRTDPRDLEPEPASRA